MINASNKKVDKASSIVLGSNNTIVKANVSEITLCYLRIYIRSRKSSKHIIDLLK